MAFFDDLRTFVYSISSGGKAYLLVSYFDDGLWTLPEILPFSREFSNLEPVFHPITDDLCFASNRPLDNEGSE